MIGGIGEHKPLKLNISFREAWQRKLFSTVERPLMRILALNEINELYSRSAQITDPICFCDKVLRAMRTRYEVSAQDLARIPENGAVVVVANHPFGGIEGIMLASILLSVRPDVKLMANFLLTHIPEMRDILIFVDPFGGDSSIRYNFKPLKESLAWLREDHILGMFPAGEVSHVDVSRREITDPQWTPMMARLVRKTKATVLPVFFKGANGPLFQTLGMVHPRLRTLLLPREVLKKSEKTIAVRIGAPIPFKKLERFEREEDITSYLRLRTYMLKNRDAGPRRPKVFSFINPKKQHFDAVAPAVNPALITAEVMRLAPDNLLVDSGEFRIYKAPAAEIPNTLREIGRLREYTFREAGEGTGKSIDLDRFDSFYTHLFLWSTKNNEVVGAYRLGDVDAIIQQHGISGIYSSTLFKYQPEFFRRISPSLEMGRSFIRPEYQKNYSSLLMLWKGIGHFVLRNPGIRYLFGPVSINDAYQPISRELMIGCLTGSEYASDLSALVAPRRPPVRKKIKELDSELARTVIRELEEVAGLIADLEKDQKSLPILLRQYLKLGGKMLCFNIDPAFSYVLDGLILVDLTKTEPRILERYMGKEGTAAYLAHHKDDER